MELQKLASAQGNNVQTRANVNNDNKELQNEDNFTSSINDLIDDDDDNEMAEQEYDSTQYQNQEKKVRFSNKDHDLMYDTNEDLSTNRRSKGILKNSIMSTKNLLSGKLDSSCLNMVRDVLTFFVVFFMFKLNLMDSLLKKFLPKFYKPNLTLTGSLAITTIATIVFYVVKNCLINF
ncbi:hypothetical protein [Heterosigma akashiwo virus 01]|uniref:Uncharacterized protein n=1 Tax=Heterosigma akashiwo virus 01 TaxID=97195 RepID=A0A1C9C599_HAV01|nr:hypothetical protein D1R72_gp129 [Heterosigma akashiwo virus 01]AOM63460.1 hypothetical protein [Heterosigma akashiwo virus 01]